MAWNWDLRAVSGPPQIPGLANLTPLGAGGMGQVYRAEDATGRVVAVKVMRRFDERSLARFEREAELLARFRAPEVVTAHTWGVTDECSYLVCALVEGDTLDVAAAGLDPPARLELFLDVVRAVSVAHAGGVLHRDLKPANVLVTAQREVRLIDFGISIGLDQERMTQTGQLVGTPAYMPPERLSSSTLPEPSQDVWSLGAVCYELLTGRLPYPARSILDFHHRLEPAPPLGTEVSPALERVVLKSLSPAPADRYATAGAMANALERALLEGQGSRARALTLCATIALLAAALAWAALGSPSSWVDPRAPLSTRPPPAQRSLAEQPSPTSPTQPTPTQPLPHDLLAKLPVVLRQGFVRGQLNARWEGRGELTTRLFEDEGRVCLRVISRRGGLVNTRPDAVVLPDMNGVEAIALRLRAPQGKAPKRVQVVLGGRESGGAFLCRTIQPGPEWTTHRVALRWFRPLKRSYPRTEDLKAIALALEGEGVIELQSVELLGGKGALGVTHVASLAFPDRDSTLFGFGKNLVGILSAADNVPADQRLLQDRVLLSLSRLRESLGSLASSSRAITLVLFEDRESFRGFWERFGQRLGASFRWPAQPTLGAYQHLAMVVYAPGDSAHLDCVQATARAFLSQSLRLLNEPDWLFEGVADCARIDASGKGLRAYLTLGPRRRVPLRQVISGVLAPKQLWQATLLVRWLQSDPLAPLGFEALLHGFRDRGDTDLEFQLKAAGTTLEAAEARWWAWVREAFPDVPFVE